MLILANVYVNTEQMDTLAVFMGWDFSWLPILYLRHLFTCQHVESGKVGGFGRRYTHTSILLCPPIGGCHWASKWCEANTAAGARACVLSLLQQSLMS